MTVPAPSLPGPPQGRPTPSRAPVGILGILAALLVGLVSLVAAPAASATPLVGAGNVVAPIGVHAGQRVGPHDQILPGQGRARAPDYDQTAVASRVGAETGPLALPEGSLPSAAEAQRLVQGAQPVGSALKDDIFHRAATFASEDIGTDGSVYRIVGGDGVQTTLIQSPGELNDIAGRFEWIVNDQGQLVHQCS